jgi:hypothetical protein
MCHFPHSTDPRPTPGGGEEPSSADRPGYWAVRRGQSRYRRNVLYGTSRGDQNSCRLLGHRDVATTMIYTHVLTGEAGGSEARLTAWA